ncbi:MAG: hypothetical protein ABFS17_12355 [Chloroflexota bacterium]
MAKIEFPLYGGNLIVIVQDKYDVYPKPLPSNCDPNINWVGNFGLSDKKTGKKLNGKVPKYRIETPNQDGKNLYYWSDLKGKALCVPGQNTIKKNQMKFRIGILDQGDPAVGWD